MWHCRASSLWHTLQLAHWLLGDGPADLPCTRPSTLLRWDVRLQMRQSDSDAVRGELYRVQQALAHRCGTHRPPWSGAVSWELWAV